MEKRFDIALSYSTTNEELVKEVYHYLKAEGFNVFFAPSQGGQTVLMGENQREIFYRIFGLESEYVALFVSKDYISRKVPMEEARIALAKHGEDGHVIPIYLDGTALPPDLFDPEETNFFPESNPAKIATHLAAKLKKAQPAAALQPRATGGMYISGNTAETQFIIQNAGDINC